MSIHGKVANSTLQASITSRDVLGVGAECTFTIPRAETWSRNGINEGAQQKTYQYGGMYKTSPALIVALTAFENCIASA